MGLLLRNRYACNVVVTMACIRCLAWTLGLFGSCAGRLDKRKADLAAYSYRPSNDEQEETPPVEYGVFTAAGDRGSASNFLCHSTLLTVVSVPVDHFVTALLFLANPQRVSTTDYFSRCSRLTTLTLQLRMLAFATIRI